LVAAGHDVTVLCAEHQPRPSIQEVCGIRIRRLRSHLHIASAPIALGFPLRLAQEDFDIVHAHLPFPWFADWSVAIARLKHKPAILSYHNDILGEGLTGLMAWLYNHTFLRFTLERVDRIVLSSNEGGRGQSPQLARHKQKTVAIPPGIDIERFAPATGRREEGVVFFLSVLDRYRYYKGLEYLLRALPRVRERIPAVKLVVGGDGPLKESYRQLAADLGIADSVEFPGRIPDESLAATFNRASLFVLPSTTSAQEGFGIVLAEAMACGIPVVATTAVGMADAVREHRAGIVVEPQDAEALAQAMLTILSDRWLQGELGRNGRALVEQRYSTSVVLSRYLELYAGCVTT